MKKIFKLFFIFSIIISAKAQTGIVSYSVTHINDKKSELIDKIKEEMELMEFTLYFNVSNSHFKKEKNISNDKLANATASALISATGDYAQIGNSKAYSHKTISNKDYQVDRSWRMKKWELKNESVKINNYTCFKAVLTEYNQRSETYFKTIAWYTPDIPVGYGPIGYGGLPGLVLQLETKKSVFKVESIILNPEETDVPPLKDGKIITYDEMIRLMRKARKVTED